MVETVFYEMGDVSLTDYLYDLNETDRTIQDDINHYLNESINRTVINACYDIFNKLIEDFKTVPKEYIEGFNGVAYKKHSFKYIMDIAPYEIVDVKVPKKPININYVIYNFKNKEVKDFFDKNDGKHDYVCKCICNGKYMNTIILYLYTISGHADIPRWVDSLQHELSHEFEQTNMGNHYNISTEYGIAGNYINSSDENERSVATILYCYDKSELKGYSNGLYGYMVAKKIIFPCYKNLRHSDYFAMLIKLKKSLEYLKKNKEDIHLKEFITKNGLKYSNIIQKGEIAVKIWEKEAARVIKQYNDEKQRIHDIFISDFRPSYI
jgi:hypothetical protein